MYTGVRNTAYPSHAHKCLTQFTRMGMASSSCRKWKFYLSFVSRSVVTLFVISCGVDVIRWRRRRRRQRRHPESISFYSFRFSLFFLPDANSVSTQDLSISLYIDWEKKKTRPECACTCVGSLRIKRMNRQQYYCFNLGSVFVFGATGHVLRYSIVPTTPIVTHFIHFMNLLFNCYCNIFIVISHKWRTLSTSCRWLRRCPSASRSYLVLSACVL